MLATLIYYKKVPQHIPYWSYFNIMKILSLVLLILITYTEPNREFSSSSISRTTTHWCIFAVSLPKLLNISNDLWFLSMKAEKAVTQNIKRYISNTLKNIQMSYLWSSQKEELLTSLLSHLEVINISTLTVGREERKKQIILFFL